MFCRTFVDSTKVAILYGSLVNRRNIRNIHKFSTNQAILLQYGCLVDRSLFLVKPQQHCGGRRRLFVLVLALVVSTSESLLRGYPTCPCHRLVGGKVATTACVRRRMPSYGNRHQIRSMTTVAAAAWIGTFSWSCRGTHESTTAGVVVAATLLIKWRHRKMPWHNAKCRPTRDGASPSTWRRCVSRDPEKTEADILWVVRKFGTLMDRSMDDQSIVERYVTNKHTRTHINAARWND